MATHGPVSSTSFRRSGERAQLRGTRINANNRLACTHTGVRALDRVLGGGIAVGSLLLIEEDEGECYSRVLMKCYLAEGVVCGHQLYLASAQERPDDIIQDLPCPVSEEVSDSPVGSDSPDEMRIAWRYQNLPKVSSELSSLSQFGHNFDVSRKMASQTLQDARFHTFYLPEETQTQTHNRCVGPYEGLLKSIQEVIQGEGFDGSVSQGKVRNVLRLGLHSLGSTLWGDDICVSESPAHSHALTSFLYSLRALLRSSLSVAVVTVPAHLIQSRELRGRVEKVCDAVVALESFNSSETNPMYKDYHGLIHIRQVPCLNGLVCEVPDNKDLAFKLRRKQFSIEKLYLPPDLSETVSRVTKDKGAWSQGCDSDHSRKQLEF
ncbi:elongator complex protein 4 [Hoplias malabaricus]|uniref:elongator complex protein 4 n=1 Tax=Hoplias malabaricus TaxID=27720 RepID=UPI00346339F8